MDLPLFACYLAWPHLGGIIPSLEVEPLGYRFVDSTVVRYLYQA